MTGSPDRITPEGQDAAGQIASLLKAPGHVISQCSIEADDTDALLSLVQVPREKADIVNRSIGS